MLYKEYLFKLFLKKQEKNFKFFMHNKNVESRNFSNTNKSLNNENIIFYKKRYLLKVDKYKEIFKNINIDEEIINYIKKTIIDLYYCKTIYNNKKKIYDVCVYNLLKKYLDDSYFNKGALSQSTDTDIKTYYTHIILENLYIFFHIKDRNFLERFKKIKKIHEIFSKHDIICYEKYLIKIKENEDVK